MTRRGPEYARAPPTLAASVRRDGEDLPIAGLSTIALVPVFMVAAVLTWAAGTRLSNATDALDARLGLGEEVGGLVLLGFATSLPELAIAVSGAVNQHYDIVIGNLIGGIAIQTALLALLDARAPGDKPLSYLVGSLALVIEAATVIAVVVIAIGGTQLPASVSLIGISPASVALTVTWVLGLMALNRSSRSQAWKAVAEGAHPGRRRRSERHPKSPRPYASRTTAVVVLVFAFGSLVTLAAGYTLEESGNSLASRVGLSSGIFGATVLAFVTALPGISTGFAAIRLGDYAMTMSEMFGGNAFAPALFIVADVLAGTPMLVRAQRSDIWIAALGVLMTAIFVVSIILRPRRTYLRMGPDSWLALVVYGLGILGLAMIPGTTG